MCLPRFLGVIWALDRHPGFVRWEVEVHEHQTPKVALREALLLVLCREILPFVLVGLLAVQESDGPLLGSPSVLRGNLVGHLHSGKNGGHLHIRTRRARIPPLACQMGLSSRRLRLPVDMDPVVLV